MYECLDIVFDARDNKSGTRRHAPSVGTRSAGPPGRRPHKLRPPGQANSQMGRGIVTRNPPKHIGPWADGPRLSTNIPHTLS